MEQITCIFNKKLKSINNTHNITDIQNRIHITDKNREDINLNLFIKNKKCENSICKRFTR